MDVLRGIGPSVTLQPRVLSGQGVAGRNENWSEYQQYASSLLALSALLLCLWL